MFANLPKGPKAHSRLRGPDWGQRVDTPARSTSPLSDTTCWGLGEGTITAASNATADHTPNQKQLFK